MITFPYQVFAFNEGEPGRKVVFPSKAVEQSVNTVISQGKERGGPNRKKRTGFQLHRHITPSNLDARWEN